MAGRRRPARTLSEELRVSRPFASSGVEAYLNVVRSAHQLQAETQVVLRREGLSVPQYNVLRILRGAGEDGLPCLGIGERMVARVPDVTRLIGRLEQAGLVTRERTPSDRRIVAVRITEEGLQRLARLERPVQDLHERQWAVLDEVERRTLIDLLTRARQRDDA